MRSGTVASLPFGFWIRFQFFFGLRPEIAPAGEPPFAIFRILVISLSPALVGADCPLGFRFLFVCF
jgi:hypothetical protein